MAEGKLVNRERFGVTIDKDLLRKFRELSDRTQIPQSKLMDRAIKLVLKDMEGQ